MRKKKLSVVLATFNEEKNLYSCLQSVKGIADEIVVVDGSSTDNTVEVAKKFKARVVITDNPPIFHINKQKALDLARYSWILQLDADEIVSPELAEEIKQVINLNITDLEHYQQNLPNRELFLRHQKLIEQRDGQIGSTTGDIVAFFVPRRNFFLGKYLKYGGTYPDGVIRLVKKDKAYFPCKSVHEQIRVQGRVGWLQHDLYHIDSPTFKRYLERNFRYIKLLAKELKAKRVKKNLWQFLNYCLYKPIFWFFWTQVRHKGLLDGWQGVVFSFFSALRFPRAYLLYLFNKV